MAHGFDHRQTTERSVSAGVAARQSIIPAMRTSVSAVRVPFLQFLA